MEKDIIEICKNFRISGDCIDVVPVTTGHINDSFRIITSDHRQEYFLQWINSHIFKDVEGLMKNIGIVTNHLAGKANQLGRTNGSKVLELIQAADGKLFFRTPQGNHYRMYRYLPETHVYSYVENESIAYEGGKAFGRFLSDLSDLPASQLTETIPYFHDMEFRLAGFHKSLIADIDGRSAGIKEEIRFIEEHTREMLVIPSLIREGHIPLRITHNDTKFNNILFNLDNKAVCVVDLDTVMPGSLLFDFGDAVRTGANTVCEDERDLEKVDINLGIFQAYAKGFIRETLPSLTEYEISNLAFSARFMTFIIGLRFLTDYLDGDIYFRTKYSTHNLDRAKVQFRLIKAMEMKAAEMDSIISRTWNVVNEVK